jgi:hypothetical protein
VSFRPRFRVARRLSGFVVVTRFGTHQFLVFECQGLSSSVSVCSGGSGRSVGVGGSAG